VIVNEELRRELFGAAPALDRDLAILESDSHSPFTVRPGIVRIVGVVGNVKHWFTGGTPHQDVEIYLPFTQAPVSSMILVAGLRSAAEGSAEQIQARVSALDADAWLASPQSMSNLFSQTIAPQRFYPVLLGSFALIALVLALVGVYGLLAYTVRLRTHEIGIRMALGASPRNVLRNVMLTGMKLVWIGIGVGTLGAFAITRVLNSLLYDTTARDPSAFLGTVLLVSVVGLLGCYIPARRATKVDPLSALRES